MRRCSPILLLLAVLPLWGQGSPESGKPGPRPAVTRSAEPDPALWVAFVPVPKGAPIHDVGGGQGTLDLGPVSYLGGARRDGVTVVRHKQRFVISTWFGLKAGGGSAASGTAKLLAFVSQLSPLQKVSLDGIRLTQVPQIVQVGVRYGAVTQHRLEVEVPVDAPEMVAQSINAISFQVLPD